MCGVMILKNRILIATLVIALICLGVCFILCDLDAISVCHAFFLLVFFSYLTYLYINKPLEIKSQNPDCSSKANDSSASNETLALTNETITEMLDIFGQGCLAFDMDGKCDGIYSRKCIDLLGIDPFGKSIFDVLLVPKQEQEQLQDLIEMIFMPPSHAIPISDLLLFLPKQIKSISGLLVNIDYKGIFDKNGYVKKIVAVLTDMTFQIEAKKMVEAEKNKAKSIIKISQRQKDFINFIKELRGAIRGLKSSLAIFSESNNQFDATKIRLDLHTLKGFAGIFGLLDLVDVIHEVEAHMSNTGVNYHALGCKIEEEMNSILTWTRLLLGNNFEQAEEMRQVKMHLIKDFYTELNNQAVPNSLKELFFENFIAIPLVDIIADYDTQISDVAMDLSKQVDPIELESNIKALFMDGYGGLFASFVHIFNNILDHGIELPEKRQELDKNPSGHIKIGIFLDTNSNVKNILRIIIQDDGAGINPEIIRNKLKNADPEGDWQQESDEEIIQRIFSPGFSTKQDISKLSGRGVGMDVVFSEVKKLGGTILVQSEVGVGTKFTIGISAHSSIS
jgi:two-component system chemotaxis sensor kinase CheA